MLFVWELYGNKTIESRRGKQSDKAVGYCSNPGKIQMMGSGTSGRESGLILKVDTTEFAEVTIKRSAKDNSVYYFSSLIPPESHDRNYSIP